MIAGKWIPLESCAWVPREPDNDSIYVVTRMDGDKRVVMRGRCGQDRAGFGRPLIAYMLIHGREKDRYGWFTIYGGDGEPECSGKYLVTVAKRNEYDRYQTRLMVLSYDAAKFEWRDLPGGWEVFFWRPFPKPYRGAA